MKYEVVDDVDHIIIKEEKGSEWKNLCKVKSMAFKSRLWNVWVFSRRMLLKQVLSRKSIYTTTPSNSPCVRGSRWG